MSRSAIAFALSLVLGGPAAAHDFWIQPDAFRLEPEHATSMTLQVGHGAERRRSLIPLARIMRFSASGPDSAVTDLKPSLRLGGDKADGVIRLPAPAAYVLALETDNRARSHLSADRFNAYLRAEGLTPALEARVRSGRTGAEGSERYARVAKSIVQVGTAGAQAPATQAMGLSLEIVPEVSPYAEPRPTTLPVRVLYRGRPVSGALIKLIELDHDETPVATRLTDRAGRASFSMPETGSWLLNVVWTKPAPAASEVDFDTIFSSLSFGFPSAAP